MIKEERTGGKRFQQGKPGRNSIQKDVKKPPLRCSLLRIQHVVHSVLHDNAMSHSAHPLNQGDTPCTPGLFKAFLFCLSLAPAKALIAIKGLSDLILLPKPLRLFLLGCAKAPQVGKMYKSLFTVFPRKMVGQQQDVLGENILGQTAMLLSRHNLFQLI